MRRCSYCRCGLGKHDENCPTIHPDAKAAKALYNTGWTTGRQGKQMDPMMEKHPIYRMGFGNGEVALEEALNGWNPY